MPLASTVKKRKRSNNGTTWITSMRRSSVSGHRLSKRRASRATLASRSTIKRGRTSMHSKMKQSAKQSVKQVTNKITAILYNETPLMSFIKKHPLYKLLDQLHVSNIVQKDSSTFNFKPIFSINKDIILNPAPNQGIVGNATIDLNAGEITQFFNDIPITGIAGRVGNNTDANSIKVNLSKFMPLRSSQIDTIDYSTLKFDIPENAKLTLSSNLLKPSRTLPIYIIYSNVFNGIPRSRKNVAHISAIIIQGGEMYSFGWGTESPAPSLLRPDQINKPGYIQSPEILSVIKSDNIHTDVNIIDIGYFTEDMRDRLDGLIQNTDKLLASSKLIQYNDVENHKHVKVVEFVVNDYKANLKDYKYWKWAARIAQHYKKFNCTTFMEYIFEGRIKCAKSSICDLGAFQFVVSDPATCKRIHGSTNNYLDKDGYTNYNAITEKLTADPDITAFGGGSGR